MSSRTSTDGLVAGGLRLHYGARDAGIDAVQIESLAIPAGACVAITGPSGSGKSSLLHLLCGIERPDAGSISWDAVELTALSEAARDRWRRDKVGLVFQDFHLLPGLSVLNNVLLPASFGGRHPSGLRQRALDLIRRVGLVRPDQDIATLSRGEMQRVAVARAALLAPPILMADEPTASLDAGMADAVAALLFELAGELAATLIVVTHDANLRARFDKVIMMDHGRIAR